MAKCHRNDVASVVLDRPTAGGSSFKLWSTFTGGSFRRKIIDTMRCGVATSAKDKPKQRAPESKSVLKKNGESERLSEILKLSESWNENEEEEVKKKVKVLEEMKRVVNDSGVARSDSDACGIA